MRIKREGIKIKRIFISLILLVCFLIVVLISEWLIFASLPLTVNSPGISYNLKSKTSLRELANDLNKKGILKNPFFFVIFAKGNSHQLKAGIYLIKRGTTARQFLQQVTSGTGLLYHSFTIIPGSTFQQIRSILHLNQNIQHTIEQMTDSEIMKNIGAKTTSAEGLFFPETYYYMEGTSDLKLLNRAYQQIQIKLKQAWESRAEGLPFKNAYQAIIAASLVEKEAHLSLERPLIAGVLVNRLKNGMLLQFDPTILYGVHKGATDFDFHKIIRKQDLRLDTPYNTYLHKGLPPTPIAMPSIDSLNAVLHPIAHTYFYFVATGSGGHQFSATLAEHHLAVIMQRYRELGFFNVTWIKNYLLNYLSQENTSCQEN